MTSSPKVLNRWFVVAGAILIQLCLGAIYAWSVFTTQLRLPVEDGGYGFTTAQTQWVFSAGLATFASVMLLAGRWQAKFGPRRMAAIGGLVLGLGYVSGGLFGSSFWVQFFCIGIIGGAGIGTAYVIPIAVGVKWFPDRKGMITGLAVAGFGFGAMLWIKMAGSWFGGLLHTTEILGLSGVQSVFVIYGIAFVILILIGSRFMVEPPAGWTPPGWSKDPMAATTRNITDDMTTSQMLGTVQYWGLLATFAGSAMAGLMVIGCIRLFGTESLMANGAASGLVSAGVIAGTAMAWYAIFNGLGRILWGVASDRLGRKASIIAMCLLQGAMMLLLFRVGKTEWGLILGACIIGFNFGGNFALFPAATADFFGNKNVGMNYPFVFLAYGLAGMVGPYVAGYFRDHAAGAGVEAWRTPFIVAGIACLAAAVVASMLHAPSHRPAKKSTHAGLPKPV